MTFWTLTVTLVCFLSIQLLHLLTNKQLKKILIMAPCKHARTNQSNTEQSEEWFPWEDKIVS